MLPDLDEFAAYNGNDDAQKKWIAASQWLVAGLELIVLVWAIYNVVVILIRGGKYKVLPLLTFYILIILLFCMRLYNGIFLWALLTKQISTLLYAPLGLKFAVGLVQTWVNVEMCTSIRHSLKMIKRAS